jgi:ribosomal peptide maturation radical SAM protein 1
MKVALVYPPYGPFGVASLGLSILSAGVQQRGFDCKIFYWNIDFLSQLPYRDRKALYLNLSCQFLFPANEWVFSRVLYPDGAVASREDMRELFLGDSNEAAGAVYKTQLMYWTIVSDMADRAHDHVSRMVDRLRDYDLVGINTSFFQNIPALALAAEVKRRWPDKIVVLGGANCNGELGITLIEQFDFLDFVFLGEADFSFPELVERLSKGLDPSDIGGIARRDHGKVVIHPPGKPVNDLNAVPVPDFSDYIEQYRAAKLQPHERVLLPLESSRGCWWGAKHHCTFCGLNADNLTQRQKSFERFREEVERVSSETGVSYFFMTDNIFYWKHLGKFLTWKNERKSDLNFFYEIRPTGHRKQVQELVQAGITMVQPGIEHFSTKILAMMDKHLVGINNLAFLKYAREYGLSPAYNVLCLFPGEDEQEYRLLAENLPKVSHLSPPNGLSPVQYHRFSPYFYRPEKYGIKLQPYRGYRYIYPFPTEVLRNLAYIFDLSEPLTAPEGSGHLLAINHVINRWKGGFSEELCTLTWDIDGDDIVIEDRRPDFPRRSYRLMGGARRVFIEFDGPATLPFVAHRMQQTDDAAPWIQSEPDFMEKIENAQGDSAMAEFLFELNSGGAAAPGDVDEIAISFTEDEFLKDPASTVRSLVESGLVYEENGSYLALPVFRGRRRTDATWRQFDV